MAIGAGLKAVNLLWKAGKAGVKGGKLTSRMTKLGKGAKVMRGTKGGISGARKAAELSKAARLGKNATVGERIAHAKTRMARGGEGISKTWNAWGKTKAGRQLQADAIRTAKYAGGGAIGLGVLSGVSAANRQPELPPHRHRNA